MRHLQPVTSMHERGTIPDYKWVLQSNHLPRRMERMHCGMVTLWHVGQANYGLCDTSHFMKKTKLVRYSDPGGKKRRPHSAPKPGVKFQALTIGKTSLTSLQEVVVRMKDHRRSAAVFICDQFRPGGAFFTGLVPGEEEQACTRSNFFFSMLEAQRAARLVKLQDHLGDAPHIPDDGAVQCLDVVVLRDEAVASSLGEGGFAPYRNYIQVPVVFAISVPQKTIDSGTRALLIRKKIDTILRKVYELQIDTLVISDSGAGHATALFHQEVGAALGLAEYSKDPPLPKEVICAGSRKFYEVVKELETNTGW